MPERYEIRGQNLPDGNKSLSPKDVYNLNKNFETVGLEVFGNADFTKKVDKKVKDLEIKTEAIISTVADKADSSLLGNYSTITQTASMIEDAVMGQFEENILINYSTHTQTADAITGAIVNKAESSEVTQLANSVALTFTNQKIGGRNLLPNSGFEEGFEGWTKNVGTETIADGSLDTMYEGKNMRITAPLPTAGRGVFYHYHNFIIGKEYTFSAWIYAITPLWVGCADATVDVAPTGWKRVSITFTATATSHPILIIFYESGENAGAYVDNIMFQEGNKLTEYRPREGEFTTTSHTFTSKGYEMKDNNGGVLIEVSKGIANEQNFGRTENVEWGYPLDMSFEIGDTTSVITSVKLKLKQYNFRTDSKGSASGGGVKTTPEGGGRTSGASSKSTTDAKWDGSSSFGVTVSQENGVVGDTHNHAIGLNQFAHSHGMAHTHTTADHSHSVDITHNHTVEFGILETPNTDGTIYVGIDGIDRLSTTNTDITLDITTWVTTNGVHTLSLKSPNMKRIQCDVFIKSYIRR